MVKTRAFSFAVSAACAAVVVAGCSSRGLRGDAPTESLQILTTPSAPSLSLAVDSGSIYGVFADPANTTLDLFTVADGPHLPSTAPAPEIIDKVDVAAPLAPFFGRHVSAAGGGSLGVLYLDRETDTKNVLKLATRTLNGTQWYLDVLEPAGDPLAVDPDGRGGFAAAWTSGLLSYRTPDARTGPAVPPISFHLLGTPAADGAGGFTAYDELSSVLLSLRWNGTGFSTQVVPGGTPVSASLRSQSGRLNVLSYDAYGRRLLLRQEGSTPDSFSTLTVTLCDGTTDVALLPGQTDSSFMFLFNETRSMGGGRIVSELSVIAPGSLLGARGNRYRKAVLSSGEAHIDGFAAARSADALYVLVSQGNLRLLRLPLNA